MQKYLVEISKGNYDRIFIEVYGYNTAVHMAQQTYGKGDVLNVKVHMLQELGIYEQHLNHVIWSSTTCGLDKTVELVKQLSNWNVFKYHIFYVLEPTPSHAIEILNMQAYYVAADRPYETAEMLYGSLYWDAFDEWGLDTKDLSLNETAVFVDGVPYMIQYVERYDDWVDTLLSTGQVILKPIIHINLPVEYVEEVTRFTADDFNTIQKRMRPDND